MKRKLNTRGNRSRRLAVSELLEVRQFFDAASLLPDNYAMHQNGDETVLAVLANDQFDADYSGVKQITSTSLGSAGGRIRVADDQRSLLYRPPADFAGVETFQYQVDGRASGHVVVSIDAPLRDDEVTFVPDRELYTIPVLKNDPFWPGYTGERRITLTGDSSFGAGVRVSDDGRSIQYERVPHVYSTDRITYIVDGKYPATLLVSIRDPLNHHQFEQLEKSGPTTYRLVQESPLWIGYAGPQRITHLLDVPKTVSLSINEDGRSVRFDSQDASGGFSFRYVVDGKFEGQMYVHVIHPVVNDFAQVTAGSQSFPMDVITNDVYYSSIAGYQWRDIVNRVTSVTPSDKGGTTSIGADGRILYTPPPNFVGTDQFRYTADDRYTATVDVVVFEPTSENQPWRGDNFTVYEGSTSQVLNVLANDFPGSGYLGSRVITKVGATQSGGIVTIAPDGKSLRFTPADAQYFDTFTYEVDNQFQATVWIQITPLTQFDSYVRATPSDMVLPVLANDFFGNANYSGPAIITSVTQPETGGEVSIAADGKSVRFSGGLGTATFHYTVDQRYTSTVAVSQPSWLVPDYVTMDQNSAGQKIDVLANDFVKESFFPWREYQGDRRVTQVSGSKHGKVSISEEGASILYEPEADFVGTETITYIVDNFLTSTVTVDVARRIRHDRVRVAPDTIANRLNVVANDLVGGTYPGPRQITAVKSQTPGVTVAVSADGKEVLYTPAPGFQGTDQLEYTIDGKLKANVFVEVTKDVAALYPKFGSLDQFQQYLLKNANFGSFNFLGGVSDFDSAGPSTQTRDHSDTNVQVDGVDEADLIETDSDYLYVVSHGQLTISRAWPADDMQVVSQTPIKGTPLGIYLLGDRVAVISQDEPSYSWPWVVDRAPQAFGPQIDAIGRFAPYFGESHTHVTLLDVTDRAAPRLVQRLEIDGSHVQTRRIDDHLYLVQRDDNGMTVQPKTICAPSGECRTETTEELKARFAQDFPSIIEETLPHYTSYGADGMMARSGLLVQPEDIFQPLHDGASSLITVVSVNLKNNEPGLASTSGVLAIGGSTLYVSRDNLYVFETGYEWSWNFSDTNDTESSVHKQLRRQDSPHTNILKFHLTKETGDVDFAASGIVPGVMLNQFSADEFEGNLRIATNVSNWRTGNFSQKGENALFVLADDGGVLEYVGSLHNLALNESIQSVRFFGERAVVTTFRTIDPLIALDLSEPTRPEVEGTLTLPGFATYMQFITPDRLLTIGPSTGFSWGGSLAVSLFDVTETENPILIDQHRWDYGSHSVASFDHHAFGWFANHDTLTIPASQNRSIRVDLDGDGYAEANQTQTIEHLATFVVDVTQVGRSDAGIQFQGQIETNSPLLRSAYIEDALYAVARDSIKSAKIKSPGVTLDEVSIIPPSTTTEPIVDPRVDRLQDLERRARALVADSMGLVSRQVMIVSSELSSDVSKMLLRVDDEQYVIQAKGNQLAAERSHYAAADTSGHQNPNNRFDTDGNGHVTSRDVLLIVNAINRGEDGLLPDRRVVGQIDVLAASSSQRMLDVNGDGYLSPRDALQVIKRINSESPLMQQESPPPSSSVAPPPREIATTDAAFASYNSDIHSTRRLVRR